MPVPQAERLLEPLERSSAALAATRPIRAQVRTLPCLAVIARYDDAAAVPEWDACYPVDATMVHAILHDSGKREPGTPLTLVVQGRPRFSREYLDAPAAEWSRELLWEAGEFLGAWVERPSLRQEHAWHHARVEPATELAAPMLVRLENGARVALCGDGFSPNGGLEGAYLSGRSLAERIQRECGAPLTNP
jgi:predicted NAD/FAD-dependent oxidoreductase